ncbi:FAD-binding oxidoreductase [Candidatus Cardinium hertigii]|uniref:Ferredoxin--NADP reductase n=1 Tax=Candidatus Cardinium hertigii TaxID=247481 RepID=A0A3N2QBQ2_9BACT|nr:FAD-binding oxidoreductase [Candidatus Cardinium hertigii]ROT47191.1 ferredoxin--NADP reductase [Candidatus Cardinium hertigii]
MGLNPFKLKLIGYKMITHRVMQFTFIRSDGLPFVFIPGQFITFLLPQQDGTVLRRSYSLANSSEECYELEMAVAPVDGGMATRTLFNLKMGDELLAVGPQGRLILKAEETPSHYILVATGTGVAPYRSMLSLIAKRLEEDTILNVTLLLGVCYAKDLLYAEDFVAFAKKNERFNFRSYLSRENTFTEGYQYPGYVHSAFEMLHVNPDRDLVYLCGNPYMIDESIEKLQKMGFRPPQIKIEKYFSSKAVPNSAKLDRCSTEGVSPKLVSAGC